MTTENRDDFVEITLAGMRFHAYVGILPYEREFAQPLEVDLQVRCAGSREILDYRDLYEATRSLVDSGALTYLETFASALLDRVLELDGVQWSRVAVRKPHVALGGPLAYAQVAMERTRG